MAYRSKAGCTADSVPKINQDQYVIHPRFLNESDKYFFGVLDGHGMNGHLVSGFLKENLPKIIENYYSQFPKDIPKVFAKSFFEVNQGLLQTGIDCSLSGSTAVTILILGNKLYCGNVGDSRAILAKKKKWEMKKRADIYRS